MTHAPTDRGAAADRWASSSAMTATATSSADRAPPMRGQREGAPRGAPSRCREMTVVTTARRTTWLFEVVLELAAPRRMTQLPQCLRLYLTDTLACDIELAPDLFEGARAAVLETEAQ